MLASVIARAYTGAAHAPRVPAMNSRRAWSRVEPTLFSALLFGAPWLVLATVARVYSAWTDHGMFWPDEFYQSLEQAHRAVFGFGYKPWEFEQGARSWAFPAFLALVLKAVSTLLPDAMDSGLMVARAAKGAMALVASAGVYFSMRLAARLGGRTAGLLAGAIVGFFPALLVYSHRCMTEVASATLVVGAALFALEGGPRRSLWAGALASVAIFCRYQNGLVAVGLFVFILAHARVKDALAYAASGTAVAGLGCALDWYTWGHLFHSFRVYVKFNFIDERASDWGVAPPSFYAQTAFTATGLPFFVLLLGAAFAILRPRALALLALGLAYVYAHMRVPHKELRFIVPVVPLVLSLCAAGLGRMLDHARAGLAGAWALSLALAWPLVAHARTMTFETMGQEVGRPNGLRPVWHSEEPPNLAAAMAGAQPDICGIVIAGIPPHSTGGYAYLHKHVPIYRHYDDFATAHANYLVIPTGWAVPPAYSLLRVFTAPSGDFALYRRDGGCGRRPILPSAERI
jgi:hypothetical protein